ncbi:hypothetical protein C2857_000718 [Epichloe festucae Fl1]|uniref:RNase III domain-containing protein n=1 Tax=Epichloe festucae (strain Fl1) TaxID=877507 RepID=A0A7S9PWA9_EPIFF|nr:hypothetical protein C2857_000718 [Epichloe festucae Fl1]
MALQPCRPLPRARHALRTLRPCLRAYATESTPTTPERFKAAAAESQDSSSPPLPRWSQTPAGMKAPFPLDHARSAHNKVWAVNNDPARLDAVYNKVLGPGGRNMLPEELKWLAVTHKSFDQGRRGFNDKLALMGTQKETCVLPPPPRAGRLTLVMEATKEIVSKAPLKGSRQTDSLGREKPFEHEQPASVDNLNVESPKDLVGKEKLFDFAFSMGLLDVVRWKPRLPRNLESSGVEVVLNGAVMAIIGAITLQHGSVVASKIVRERILARLSRE